MMISIIIPVFNDVEGLRTTLSSLQNALEFREDTEIIVCNDGGGNTLSETINQYGAKEAKLTNNLGSYAARNAGIHLAKGSTFVFLDADQLVSTTWLDEGLKALEHADYVGGHICIFLNNKNDVWEQKDKAFAFSVERCLKNQHFAPTANLFVRRTVVNKVGLFDERLRSSGDVDFGQRVYNSGFTQAYCRSATTYHPARSKAEQLKKMRRIGKGLGDKKLLVDKRTPVFVVTYAVLCLLKLPFEAAYRLLRGILWPGENKRGHIIKIVLIEKYCKLTLLKHMLIRAWFP